MAPSTGGTRLNVYETPAAGLGDALRLAEAMTFKLAVAEMPCGGGKAVLAGATLPSGAARVELLEAYAEVVVSLGGSFQTGPDLSTSPADMDLLAQRSAHVICRNESSGGSGDPGRYTAEGVLYGIKASVERVFGSPSLDGRRVLVQGLGSVGSRLARLAARDGARVLLSDIDAERVRPVAEDGDYQVVPAAEALGIECDVYAPCALGGTPTVETIAQLRCPIVAGGANNQLGGTGDAQLLRERGILYAPDFVINAVGVVHAIGTETLAWSAEATAAAIAGIGERLTAIFERADRDGVSTEQAARTIFAERLQIARPSAAKRAAPHLQS